MWKSLQTDNFLKVGFTLNMSLMAMIVLSDPKLVVYEVLSVVRVPHLDIGTPLIQRRKMKRKKKLTIW